jgi:hypothetical protein
MHFTPPRFFQDPFPDIYGRPPVDVVFSTDHCYPDDGHQIHTGQMPGSHTPNIGVMHWRATPRSTFLAAVW